MNMNCTEIRIIMFVKNDFNFKSKRRQKYHWTS